MTGLGVCMNEQRTAVLVDSGCDVPQKVRKELDIRILPLRVIYPEKDYKDGVDLDPKEVYRRFPEFPSTSTPSIAEVTDLLDSLAEEGYEHVIAVTISSGLSGTFNTVRLAASEQDTLDVRVYDSKNISIGAGLYAIWAARALEEGRSLEDVWTGLQNKLGDSKVFFYMDTLKYLQRGGRIGRVAGMVGEVLRLKPIISCDADGTYYTVAKIRGTKMARLKLFEEVLKFCLGHRTWLVVEEGDAHEEAMAMDAMLHEHIRNGEVLFEHQITATMAINTGPGLVGVAVLREP